MVLFYEKKRRKERGLFQEEQTPAASYLFFSLKKKTQKTRSTISLNTVCFRRSNKPLNSWNERLAVLLLPAASSCSGVRFWNTEEPQESLWCSLLDPRTALSKNPWCCSKPDVLVFWNTRVVSGKSLLKHRKTPRTALFFRNKKNYSWCSSSGQTCRSVVCFWNTEEPQEPLCCLLLKHRRRRTTERQVTTERFFFSKQESERNHRTAGNNRAVLGVLLCFRSERNHRAVLGVLLCFRSRKQQNGSWGSSVFQKQKTTERQLTTPLCFFLFFFFLTEVKHSYQLDLLTPIIAPFAASSLNTIREILILLYTERALPVITQRFLILVNELFLFNLLNWKKEL